MLVKQQITLLHGKHTPVQQCSALSRRMICATRYRTYSIGITTSATSLWQEKSGGKTLKNGPVIITQHVHMMSLSWRFITGKREHATGPANTISTILLHDPSVKIAAKQRNYRLEECCLSEVQVMPKPDLQCLERQGKPRRPKFHCLITDFHWFLLMRRTNEC